MAEKRAGMFNAMLGEFARHPWLQQLLIMVGIAASVALGVAAVLWSQGPDYRMLYTAMSPDRASAVVDTLSTVGIPYRLQEHTGAVMVPADKLHEARLKLAGAGITSESGGMDMLQEANGFGVSEFMESKKYQHALENELARTIESMHQVRKARVHLALPKQTVFVRDRRPPSASIMLDVFPGSVIERPHVAAIVNLVASSIPELPSEQVTVVDQHGNLLSQLKNDKGLAQSGQQFEYQQRVERGYEERIAQLLTPITGAGKVRVQVAADIDFSTEEESRESWNPDRQVVRSEQINTEKQSAADAGGVPGALSNQPPAAAKDDKGEKEKPEEITTNQSITRNFEIERVLNHRSNPSGLVRKLSVAVVLDNRRQTSETGEQVSVPVPQEELARLTQLVRYAIGYDENRGDQVTVISADFRQQAGEPAESAGPAFWESAWFASLVKQALVGIALLFIVLGILRPGIRTLTHPPQREPGQLPPGEGTEAQFALAGSARGLPPAAGSAHRAELGAPQRRGTNFDEKMDAMRAAAEDDPRRVAQVVRKWVSEDAE